MIHFDVFYSYTYFVFLLKFIVRLYIAARQLVESNFERDDDEDELLDHIKDQEKGRGRNEFNSLLALDNLLRADDAINFEEEHDSFPPLSIAKVLTTVLPAVFVAAINHQRDPLSKKGVYSSWLVYKFEDEVKEPNLCGAFCSICSNPRCSTFRKQVDPKSKNGTIWVDVPSSAKNLLDACLGHAKSKSHLDAVSLLAENQGSGAQPSLITLRQVNEKNTKKSMMNRFSLVFYVASEVIANGKYGSMLDLVSKISPDSFKLFSKIEDRDFYYEIPHFFNSALFSISHVFLEQFLTEARASLFFSLGGDATELHQNHLFTINLGYVQRQTLELKQRFF